MFYRRRKGKTSLGRRNKCMLLETTDSVTDIAMAVGFSESSYFARTFKSKMGMSPLKYRKTMKDIVDKA